MENITVSIRRVGLLGIRPNTAMPIATNKTANNNYTYPRISLDTTIHICIYVQTKNVKALVLINKLHTFQRYLNISIWHVRIFQYGFETCQLCPDDEQCPTSPTYRFIQNRTSKVTIHFSTTSFRAYLETWKSQSVFPTLLGPSSISFFVFWAINHHHHWGTIQPLNNKTTNVELLQLLLVSLTFIPRSWAITQFW